ncbi:MAG TPA: DUF1572 family protein [Blastocatellia bacterium]|nr:DUF1572 family protein [Blastocatellia bacterium]HMV82105.1 DUF1572 family protein [Blastocatellia bacterium]HMX24433.1 DUF1572 family protein [Blastocatellia bacterium]HMY73579.1 DUF1572 family protein [Blastocatellia bacterium]HMZ21981.1 DUF1572 family protein [Blastocatellia bacterium]
MTDLGRHYLDNAVAEFRLLKKQGERAMAQLTDEEFFVTLDAESNSVALLIKHLAGNMRSRWTDFLTSDGEKPDRFRDREFELDGGTTRERLLQWWEQGWQLVFNALEPLQPEDALRTVIIRREPHTVVQAVNRQLTHYATHVGQIVFLAKHLKANGWQTLSVPRGQSEQFNQQHLERLQAKADQQQPLSRY